MAGILVVLSVVLIFSSLSSSAKTHLPPYTQMEQAHLLQVMWDKWISLSPWDDGLSPDVDRSKVDAPCDVPPEETLKMMYYTRFAVTLHVAGYERDEKEYILLQNMARRISFYEKKMGVPPLRDRAHFCKNPSNRPKVPSAPAGSDFNWPPTPYPLVCDQSAGKCVACGSGVTQAELKEACNLLEPPEEPLPPPTEAQLYYEDLKERLRGFPRSSEWLELEKREIRIEGAKCTAPPQKTVAYIMIEQNFQFSSTRDDTETYAHFEEDWDIINHLSKNLTVYKEIFDGFSFDDVENFVYCKYSLIEPDHYDYDNRDEFFEGGLVCGGRTCKSCKEWPKEEDESQRWTFEDGGPLSVGCARVTTLGNGPRAGTNKECPKLDQNPKYCGAYRRDGCDGEYESMADFWRRAGATGVFKFRGSFISTLLCVVAIHFL